MAIHSRQTVTGWAPFVGACPEHSRRNGDINRLKKTEGDEIALYTNQCFEKNLVKLRRNQFEKSEFYLLIPQLHLRGFEILTPAQAGSEP
jgi:hypothetical protein